MYIDYIIELGRYIRKKKVGNKGERVYIII